MLFQNAFPFFWLFRVAPLPRTRCILFGRLLGRLGSVGVAWLLGRVASLKTCCTILQTPQHPPVNLHPLKFRNTLPLCNPYKY